MTNQILISPPFFIGQKPKIKNTMKKTKPKFLFELVFILDFRSIIIFLISYKFYNIISGHTKQQQTNLYFLFKKLMISCVNIFAWYSFFRCEAGSFLRNA